jgi:ubiquinone biosynthesis protein COQ9
MKQQPQSADRILDVALSLGEASAWEAVHLHAIASELGTSLNEVRRHFPQKDALVEAWFDRADQAALALHDGREFTALPRDERLQRLIMTWLDALAPHRRLTREMLAYKLEPGHVHLQAQGILRISRTVQWFREAAHHDSRGARRILEESLLTMIYLTAFTRWLYDDSPDFSDTRRLLEQSLRRMEKYTPAPSPRRDLPAPDSC